MEDLGLGQRITQKVRKQCSTTKQLLKKMPKSVLEPCINCVVVLLHIYVYVRNTAIQLANVT